MRVCEILTLTLARMIKLLMRLKQDAKETATLDELELGFVFELDPELEFEFEFEFEFELELVFSDLLELRIITSVSSFKKSSRPSNNSSSNSGLFLKLFIILDTEIHAFSTTLESV